MLLPLVAGRLDAVEAVVFVDALLPAAHDSTTPSLRLRSFVDE